MKSIAIVGGGVSAMILAAELDEKWFDVTIYEHNKTLGRKFLVAGDGGLNLTHSEDIESFISRYTPSAFLEPCIRSFTNKDFRHWLGAIGIETFVGTSKRVFPVKGIKPIEVLNLILARLRSKNVRIKTQHTWLGWEGNELVFQHHEQTICVKADVVVFALGGASWSKTGSDGTWLALFKNKGINVLPFQSSNCAFKIDWPPSLLDEIEGESLKNISLSCNKMEKKGEVVVTKFGLEGGAIYALSPTIRHLLHRNVEASISIDLKPSFSEIEIIGKLTARGNRSLSTALSEIVHLSDVHVALLKLILTKEEYTDITSLARKIKHFPLTILGTAPLEEAISTVGGIALDEVDESFQLKKMQNHYVIGEMLDWDAPTGGYLLQACFSMGYLLAHKLN